MKSSEALSKKARGEFDDLLDAVSKLCLCPSTRSAVGVYVHTHVIRCTTSVPVTAA